MLSEVKHLCAYAQDVRMAEYFVYSMINHAGTLYTGMTNNL